MPFTLVPRSEWGGGPFCTTIPELPTPIMKVVMTKTGTEPCNNDEECINQMKKLQKYHVDQGHPDIPYNFVVTPDCKVYEGRGWKFISPTPKERPEMLNKTIVIAHIGNFPDCEAIQREMYITMGDFLEDALHNLKLLHEDYDLRCLPCWHDYSESGLNIIYNYPKYEESS